MSAAPPDARRPPRIFYGWWIVGAAFILQLLTNVMFFNSFGAYFVYLQGEFGWSRTVLSGAYSLIRLETGFLSPAQSWLINRIGPRAVIRIGIVVFAAGFLVVSLIDSIPSYYVAFIIVGTGSALVGFLTCNIVLVNWFERGRARAVSFAGSGQSVGGLLVPAIVWLLALTGWRTAALVCAGLLLVFGLPMAQLFHRTPEAIGLRPDGAPDPQPRPGAATTGAATGSGAETTDSATKPAPPPRLAVPPGPTFSVSRALRTPAFWWLSLGHAFALVTVNALNVHLIPFLVDAGNTSLEVAGLVVALVTGTQFGGQLITGVIGDRVDKRVLATICMGGHTLATLLVVLSTSMPVVLAFAALHGLAWGVRAPLMMTLRADYFGRRSFATIEGLAQIVATLGSVIGPLLVGAMADQLGSYTAAFLTLTAVSAVGGALFLLADRPPAIASART